VRIARFFLPLLRYLPTNWLLPIVRADLERGYYDAIHATHSIDKYQRPFNSDEGRNVFLDHLAALDARETDALAARLTDVVMPAAIIWGSHDPFLPMSLGKRLAKAMPNATIDILSGARHFTPEEEPREVAEILGALLSRPLSS
jgi:pimeloyl-ACP methyl ester carboxylesterase